MCRAASITLTFVLASTVAGSAWARQPVSVTEWSHGTTLNGFVGATADAKQTGPVVGGAAGWEITPRIAIEGSGAWTDFGAGTTSFAGAVTARVRIAGKRKIDPFVHAGIGLYRATFGANEIDVPEFYSQRMTVHRTFTDPSIVAGGGVSLFVNRSVAVRPDAETAVVFRGGHRLVVTTVAMHVVYHFETSR